MYNMHVEANRAQSTAAAWRSLGKFLQLLWMRQKGARTMLTAQWDPLFGGWTYSQADSYLLSLGCSRCRLFEVLSGLRNASGPSASMFRCKVAPCIKPGDSCLQQQWLHAFQWQQ